jgi:hypothetical protein
VIWDKVWIFFVVFGFFVRVTEDAPMDRKFAFKFVLFMVFVLVIIKE